LLWEMDFEIFLKQNKVQQMYDSLIIIIFTVIGSLVVTTLDWEPKGRLFDPWWSRRFYN
jgi:hypothetical protein